MVCLTQLSRQVGRVCHMQQSSRRDARRVEGARGNTRVRRRFLPARALYLTLNSESYLRLSIWPNAPRRSQRYRVARVDDNEVSAWVSSSSAGKLEVCLVVVVPEKWQTQYGDSLIEVTDLNFSLTYRRKKRKALKCKWPANKNINIKKKTTDGTNPLGGSYLNPNQMTECLKTDIYPSPMSLIRLQDGPWHPKGVVGLNKALGDNKCWRFITFVKLTVHLRSQNG